MIRFFNPSLPFLLIIDNSFWDLLSEGRKSIGVLSTADVEGLTADVEGSTADVEGSTTDVEGSTADVEDSTADVEGKAIDLM